MAANESGHHINVDNLDPLMEEVKNIGSLYKPIKNALKLPNLINLHDQGKNQLLKVAQHHGAWKLAVDDRQELFVKINPLVTRIIGNLYGMDVKTSLIEDARQMQAKISSTRLSKPKQKDMENDQEQDEKKHSVSQQSYNSILNNFSSFLALLSKAEGYETNEQDLSLDALEDFKAQLQQANTRMNSAASGLSGARMQRDVFLYTPETGLVDTALSVKNYIKGIYGAKHPQYLSVLKIKFRNIRKKK